VIEGRASVRQLAVNWGASFVGNLAGALLAVAAVTGAGLLGQSGPAIPVALAKVSLPFGQARARRPAACLHHAGCCRTSGRTCAPARLPLLQRRADSVLGRTEARNGARLDACRCMRFCLLSPLWLQRPATTRQQGRQRGLCAAMRQAFIRAIMCNWLVCMALWLATSASTLGSKFMGIWLPISAFAAIGLEHCVANMCARAPAGPALMRALPAGGLPHADEKGCGSDWAAAWLLLGVCMPINCKAARLQSMCSGALVACAQRQLLGAEGG